MRSLDTNKLYSSYIISLPFRRGISHAKQ